MFNPLTFIAGFSLPTKLILIGAVAFAGFIGGWKVAQWQNDSQQLNSVATQLVFVDKHREDSKPIIDEKNKTIATLEDKYRKLRSQINEQNNDLVCFDSNSLSMWNNAIAGTNTHRRELDGESSGVSTPESGNQEEIGKDEIATVEEILLNASDNFEIANKNIAKHRACVAELRLLSGNVCACSE